MKIGSFEELNKVRDEVKADISIRGDLKEMQVIVHMGTCGIASGARNILSALAREIRERGIDTLTLRQSSCIGLCDQEPICTLLDGEGNEFRYGRLNAEKVKGIVREHVLKGRPVTEYLVKENERRR